MDRTSTSNGSHDEGSATDQDLQIVCEDKRPEYKSVADGSGDKCTWTVLNSDGNDMEVQGTSCDLGKDYGIKAGVHGKIHVLDSENGTGSMEVTLTGNGQTMNGQASYTGKWIGESCPRN
jgi:Protein of unknown function (DUF3617)